MKHWKKYVIFAGIFLAGMNIHNDKQLYAQNRITLTLDSAVEIAMGSSYSIKQLQLGIERNRYNLKARQASLKSRVYMNLRVPEIEAVSDYKWNSTLKKDEIIKQNTQLLQMDLSVRQPVVLLGYPTNGYLSLNNKMYQYIQRDGYKDVNYYNRYYVRYEQPFFLPNSLKNDIEDAELDLERRELEYIDDWVRQIDSIADDYYDLWDLTYRNLIYSRQEENLQRVVEIAEAAAREDTERGIEKIQVQVECANAQEMLLKNHANIRMETMRIKQRLRMSDEDSVCVEPEVKVTPVNVDMEQAIQYGFSLRPRLRMLSIDKRKNEINVSNAKGWDAFNVNLEMTYGLEKQDERYQEIWEDYHTYDNSYSMSLRAYVPIWDWGRRKYRIEAEKIGVKRTELNIEENRNNIRSNIANAVSNLIEYQQRVINLQSSLDMVQQITDVSTQQYRENIITVQDILQIITRQKDTELNFLDAYLGYRRSLISLMMQTYYDYENDISLIDKFHSGS